MTRIILVYGMPCSGKTTICDCLMSMNYNNQIRTDEVRIKHFPQPSYSEDESNQVFNFLFEELQIMLNKKYKDIVIEGVFATSQRILMIKELAFERNYTLICIYLKASLESLLLRNTERTDPSKILKTDRFQMFRKRFSSANLYNLSIDTGIHTKDETITIIKKYLQNGR